MSNSRIVFESLGDPYLKSLFVGKKVIVYQIYIKHRDEK